MISEEFISIDVSEINLEDDLFHISYGENGDKITESIKMVGLINPPLLQKKEHNCFRIVLGFRRLSSIVKLKFTTVKALIVTSNVPNIELLELVIQDIKSVRNFNAIENSIILNKLINTFGIKEEEIINKYLPLLGLGINPVVIDRYLPLITLEPPIQKWLAEDRLSIEVAHDLLRMPTSDRLAIIDLIITLHLGKNQQRDILILSADVANLNNQSVSSLYECAEVKEILQNIKLSPAHRLIKLKNWLKVKRYPQYSETLQRFERLRKQLNLPPKSELTNPHFFESKEYVITSRFQSQQELSSLAIELQKLAKSNILKEILTLV